MTRDGTKRAAEEVDGLTRLQRAGIWVASAASLNPENRILKDALWWSIAAAVLGSIVVAGVGATSAAGGSSWRFDPALLVAGVAGFVGLQAWHMAMWILLLKLLGGRAGKLWAATIWCASILARYVPSGMLLPIVRAAMAERGGIPKRVTFASTLYEIALTACGALILGGYFLIQLPGLEGEAVRFLAIALPVAVLVCLHPRVFAPLSERVLRRLGREALPATIPFGQLLACAALYAFSFALGGLAVLAVAASLHPIASGDVTSVIAAFGVTYIVTLLAFVLPAGLGAREAALAAALTLALPAPVAITVAVAVRVIQIVVEVGLAALTSLWSARRAAGGVVAARPARAANGYCPPHLRPGPGSTDGGPA